MRFPAADLFGILPFEAIGVSAVMIGEDLGSVPAGHQQAAPRSISRCRWAPT